jgi:hypothetical protein
MLLPEYVPDCDQRCTSSTEKEESNCDNCIDTQHQEPRGGTCRLTESSNLNSQPLKSSVHAFTFRVQTNGLPDHRRKLPLEQRVLPTPDKGSQSIQDLPRALQTNQARKRTGTIQTYSNSTRAGMLKMEIKS